MSLQKEVNRRAEAITAAEDAEAEAWAAEMNANASAKGKRSNRDGKRPRQRDDKRSKWDSKDNPQNNSGSQSTKKNRPNPNRAWRFAKSDRIRCNTGGKHGWTAGKVAALDEPDKGTTLPYVVMLDKPIAKLICVPNDDNSCARPEVCYAEWPDGGACAKAVASEARPAPKHKPLRFKVGDRVCCLTAGPDGTRWPRAWVAGTVKALWHKPNGASDPDAVLPYRVELVHDSTLPVLVHQDDYLYIRSYALQPVGNLEPQKSLGRFTVRRNEEKGYDEKTDQQTMKTRKACTV